jgi:hypothetical protein
MPRHRASATGTVVVGAALMAAVVFSIWSRSALKVGCGFLGFPAQGHAIRAMLLSALAVSVTIAATRRRAHPVKVLVALCLAGALLTGVLDVVGLYLGAAPQVCND